MEKKKKAISKTALRSYASAALSGLLSNRPVGVGVDYFIEEAFKYAEKMLEKEETY